MGQMNLMKVNGFGRLLDNRLSIWIGVLVNQMEEGDKIAWFFMVTCGKTRYATLTIITMYVNTKINYQI